jgi:glyoxylase-like metal-dependent hydrolase (beta-lactamase superfamily II)
MIRRLLIAVPLLAAAPLSAQTPENSLESYRRARAVLDASLEAYGGVAQLRAPRSISIRHEGQSHWRNQSPRVAPPYAATATSGLLVLDLAGNRVLWETQGEFPGGIRTHSRLVFNPADGWQANLVQGRWFTLPQATPAQRAGFARRVPHLVMLGALDRAAQLRWQGRTTYEGRPHDVISHAAADNAEITLFLDASTHLLSKWEQVITDVEAGDALLEVAYSEYAPVGGIPMPRHRVLRRAGAVAEDVRYLDAAVDVPLPDSLFARPQGLVDGTGGPAPDTTLTTLAPDVYLVRGVAGGNNSLAVAFNDYFLVVEAYGNDAASQRTIAMLKAAVPGKPIRYLVPTHHHDDHTGGVRGFVAEGATIVTTPGNRGYFDALARATYTIAPDVQSRVRAPLKLETISGKRRRFSDGTHVVDVIDMGPSPHADEMIVVYLPRERILVQGDLLNRPPDGRVIPGNPVNRHFLEWIERSRLAVDRIVAVHGPPHTVADLRAVVQAEGAAR